MGLMHETGFEQALAELAVTADVRTEWVDAWGNPQVVSAEHLLGVLRALTGSDLSSEAEIRAASRQLVEDRPDIEPVVFILTVFYHTHYWKPESFPYGEEISVMFAGSFF